MRRESLRDRIIFKLDELRGGTATTNAVSRLSREAQSELNKYLQGRLDVAIVAYYASPADFVLLTTDTLFIHVNNVHEELPWHFVGKCLWADLMEGRTDINLQAEGRRLNVITRDGKERIVSVEPGQPCMALWSLIMLMSRTSP